MSVDTTDCEPWDVYSEQRKRRARKDHVCYCCAETIRRGDLYVYEFAVFEGSPDEIKRCLRCQAIYDHLVSRHRGMEDTAVDRELKCGHTYREVFAEDPPEHIAALAFALPGDSHLLEVI
jgi:hypothetical protein